MYLFCPQCGTLLVVEEGPSTLRFSCNTCPYVQNITEKVTTTFQAPFLYLLASILVVLGFISAVSKVERGRRRARGPGSMGECGHNRRFGRFL